jgi:predicted transcriptional regulator
MASKTSLNSNKVLELNSRKKIYHLVQKYAGCHFRDLERKSSLPASSLRYHLNYLVRHGLIHEENESNNLRYFPREFNSEYKQLLGLLRENSLRKIILFILSNKNCSHQDIVRFTNLSPSTVSWHLKKLLSKKVISSHKKGRETNYNVEINEKEVINVLIVYQESFLDTLVNQVINMWDI